MGQRVSWLVVGGSRRANACPLFVTRTRRRQVTLEQIELVRRHCTEVGWWRLRQFVGDTLQSRCGALASEPVSACRCRSARG